MVDLFDLLTPRQLCRAVITKKNYIRVQSGGNEKKVTFTNKAPDFLDLSIYYADLACDQTALHYHAKNLIQSITRSYGFNCYYYSDFNSFLKESFSINEHQYKTILKWCEE